jgi:hypothetical protein
MLSMCCTFSIFLARCTFTILVIRCTWLILDLLCIWQPPKNPHSAFHRKTRHHLITASHHHHHHHYHHLRQVVTVEHWPHGKAYHMAQPNVGGKRHSRQPGSEPPPLSNRGV